MVIKFETNLLLTDSQFCSRRFFLGKQVVTVFPFHKFNFFSDILDILYKKMSESR